MFRVIRTRNTETGTQVLQDYGSLDSIAQANAHFRAVLLLLANQGYEVNLDEGDTEGGEGDRSLVLLWSPDSKVEWLEVCTGLTLLGYEFDPATYSYL